MAKKTDEFVRRLMRVIEPSNFHWVEQSIKDLAEEAVDERIEKLENKIKELENRLNGIALGESNVQ